MTVSVYTTHFIISFTQFVSCGCKVAPDGKILAAQKHTMKQKKKEADFRVLRSQHLLFGLYDTVMFQTGR